VCLRFIAFCWTVTVDGLNYAALLAFFCGFANANFWCSLPHSIPDEACLPHGASTPPVGQIAMSLPTEKEFPHQEALVDT